MVLSRSDIMGSKTKNKLRKPWENCCVGRGRLFTIRVGRSQRSVSGILKKHKESGSLKDKRNSWEKKKDHLRQDRILV